ncbi:Ribonuclease E [hydrothermal vent metagenome]|uniref:Ribonuclease G n=1 Tax=hydrothermal vent metagenome TaxID=652676 RepID=A0A3B0VCY7_9ZZZZ
MKRMLINATHSEEIRVALADGQKLYNLDIDIPGHDRTKGNIYKGRITRVEPSLEAAFVDYGANRHGFLPYKEISRNYYTKAANQAKERPPIAKAIKEGTEVIIQVNKEERSNKGAAITTYISLAGRYMVYMPENPSAGGISRRIEGKARQDLKDTLSKVTQPKNSGVIIRTAGIGRTPEELEWDLNYLDQVWTAIKTVAANRPAPFFIYQESDIFIRALRDYLGPDVGEILIDSKEIYEKARDFMQQVMPHNLKKLSYYNDTIPLFSRYQIESQIQSAFSREVHLPSGGSIVIDHTEAMIAIDINSARATKGSDIEETALNTNLEAADEIARQLRIRDLGGLVVIDFIDMRNSKNQRSVELQLDEAISNDRARTQTSKISRFGLLEMSRQRLRSSISDSSQFVCPRCSGHGLIRNIESLSVSILRIMEEEALKPGTGKVVAQVPTKVANFIINEKRAELTSLESRHSVPMLVVANEFYQTPQFDITRLKKSEANSVDMSNITLNKPESEEAAENKSSQTAHQHRKVAAVDVLVPDSQAPARTKPQGNFTGWFKSLFTSNGTATDNNDKTNSDKKPQQNYKKDYKKDTQNSSTKPRQYNKKTQQKSHSAKRSKPAKSSANLQNKNTGKQQTSKKQTSQKQQPQKNQPAKKQQPKPNKSRQPQQKTAPKKAPTAVTKPQSNKDTVETAKTSEEILNRPLGSVVSYAASKTKQQQSSESIKDSKTKQEVTTTNKPTEKSPAVKQQPNKPVATKAEPKNKENLNIASNSDSDTPSPSTPTQKKAAKPAKTVTAKDINKSKPIKPQSSSADNKANPKVTSNTKHVAKPKIAKMTTANKDIPKPVASIDSKVKKKAEPNKTDSTQKSKPTVTKKPTPKVSKTTDKDKPPVTNIPKTRSKPKKQMLDSTSGIDFDI